MAIAIAASLQVSAQKNNNQQMTAQQRTESLLAINKLPLVNTIQKYLAILYLIEK